MSQVETEIWAPDPKSVQYSKDHPNVQSEGVIGLKWSSSPRPGRTTGERKSATAVYFPFKPTAKQIKEHGYDEVDMNIWSETPPALIFASTDNEKAQDSNAWLYDLLDYLDTSCKEQNPPRRSEDGTPRGFQYDMTKPFALMRSAPSHPRHVMRNAPRKEQLGYQPIVGFQDSYPVQILNLASVRDVGSRLEAGAPSLSALNFRPNIVVVGGDAYEEDRWKYIKIGKTEFHVACRTARCLMPNVDQSTGKKHELEPNKTMRSFRKIDSGCEKEACLGMHMVPAVQHEKWMHTGDIVEIIETTEEHYYKGSK